MSCESQKREVTKDAFLTSFTGPLLGWVVGTLVVVNQSSIDTQQVHGGHRHQLSAPCMIHFCMWQEYPLAGTKREQTLTLVNPLIFRRLLLGPMPEFRLRGVGAFRRGGRVR